MLRQTINYILGLICNSYFFKCKSPFRLLGLGRNTSFDNEPFPGEAGYTEEESPPSTPSTSSSSNLKPVLPRERSTSAPNVSLNSVNMPSNFLEVSEWWYIRRNVISTMWYRIFSNKCHGMENIFKNGGRLLESCKWVILVWFRKLFFVMYDAKYDS